MGGQGGPKPANRPPAHASRSQIATLDLGRASYVSYGVKYIGLVSLTPAHASQAHITNLDLGRAPYVSYGVKYVGLVSLAPAHAVNLKFLRGAPFFQNGLQSKTGCGVCFDIGSQHLGCLGQNTSPHAQGCDLSRTVSHLINHT